MNKPSQQRLRLLLREPVIYVIILSLIGLLLVFLVPPFQSPDEQTHFYRAYQLSEGHLVGKRLSYGAGDVLPASLSDSFQKYYYLLFAPQQKVHHSVYISSLQTPLATEKTREIRFENTAIYPPAAYVPQILGIWLGRLFSAGPIELLYLCRLANLAAWLTVLGWCMKRNKRVALPLFAFAMVPIVVFQASSASADVFTTAVALFFSLELFRLYKLAAISRRDLITIFGLGVLLALCKFPYVFLSGLVLLLPAHAFSTKRIAVLYKLGLLAVCGLLTLIWLVVAQKTFVNLRAGIDTPLQLHFIIGHPWDFLKVLFNTYVSLPSDGLYLQFIGQLGWLDTKLPLWSLFAAGSSVLFAVITMPRQRSEPATTARQKTWMVIVTGLTVLAITVSLYLTWNPPRAGLVDGLQGRYYMALFGTLVMLLGGLLKLQKSQFAIAQRIVWVLSGASIVSTLITISLRYYAL